jgi:hypothetical protein
MNNLMARHAHSTQIPQLFVSPYIRIFFVMDVFGAPLPARLAYADATLENKLTLHGPNSSLSIPFVRLPPLPACVVLSRCDCIKFSVTPFFNSGFVVCPDSLL